MGHENGIHFLPGRPSPSFLLICMVDFLTSVHRQHSHLGRTIVSEIARGSEVRYEQIKSFRLGSG
jgi:hypothetical protein